MVAPASQFWQPMGVVILAASTGRGTLMRLLKLTQRSVCLLMQTKHVPVLYSGSKWLWQRLLLADIVHWPRHEDGSGIITASCSVVVAEETYA